MADPNTSNIKLDIGYIPEEIVFDVVTKAKLIEISSITNDRKGDMIKLFRRCSYCNKSMLWKKIRGEQRTVTGTSHPVYIPGKGDITRWSCLDCEMTFDED